jgi:hypothetical protein
LEEERLSCKKLHNFDGKLHNFGFENNSNWQARNMTEWYTDEHGNERMYVDWGELVDYEADDWDPNDPYLLKAEARYREAEKRQREEEAAELAKAEQAKRNLHFTRDELDQYVANRVKGIAQKSRDWIFRSSDALWTTAHGEISQDTVNALRDSVVEKYKSADSHSKVLSFARSFLSFLATTHSDPRYQTFAPYLELPKVVKERKRITSRIVTKENISGVLKHIEKAQRHGEIDLERSAQYSAFVLFGAYTGQRSEATISKLTVGQFREALAVDKPVLKVDSSQDKVRMSHYVPLHPRVVEALKPLLVGRGGDELMFTHSSFLQWLKRQKIPMSRFNGHFTLGDLRKFAEQHGDIIQWDQSNRAYILTHGVSGIDWKHYKHPLPENVYDVYMKAWQDVDLII